MKQRSVLPAGWQERFFDRADLELSFREIQRTKHFYADVLRGRIRSLQLRVEEAFEHFERAQEKSTRARETIPNLVRSFTLHIYVFDNALAAGPIPQGADVPTAWIPELPEYVLEEYPELRYVINLRKRAEGMLRLHLGEYEAAIAIFEDLLESDKEAPEDALFTCYRSIAAAQQNLGFEDDAMRSLENAELAVQAGGRLLNRARAAGVLYAHHAFLENRQQAEDWRLFLERLDCPRPTKDVFLKRGRVMLKRSMDQSRLLPI